MMMLVGLNEDLTIRGPAILIQNNQNRRGEPLLGAFLWRWLLSILGEKIVTECGDICEVDRRSAAGIALTCQCGVELLPSGKFLSMELS